MKMLGIRMYREPPCQNCPDREIGCHGKCPTLIIERRAA